MKPCQVFLCLLFAQQQLPAQGFVYPVGDPNKRPSRIFPNSNGYQLFQEFMNENDHTGVDLANGTEGGEVRAIGFGTISLKKSTADSHGWGNVVLIRHELAEGIFYSFYAHMKEGSVLVEQYDQVKSGQPIGKVDCTGNTKGQPNCPSNNGRGSHLHFAIKRVNSLGCGYINKSSCLGGDSFSNYVEPLEFIAEHQFVSNLDITKADIPDPVTSEGRLTYTVTVENRSGAVADGVVVTDTLPAGTILRSCTVPMGCTESGDTVTAMVGTLEAETSALVVLEVQAPAVIESTVITNTATVEADGLEPQTSALVSTTVVPSIPKNSWIQRIPPTAPVGRVGHALAFDSARREVVLVGGNANPGVLNETWVWNGSDWMQRAGHPTVITNHALASDAARSQVVLFGGDIPGSPNPDSTWTWDGVGWHQQFPLISPPGRVGHAMAFDQLLQEVVLFGGAGPGNLNDTWVWDGANWKDVSSPARPSPRQFAAMAHDAARGEIILFGGLEAGQFLGDTWVWNGTNWVERSPPKRPSPRHLHALAYDAAQGHVVLFGGKTSGNTILGDTWVWDGSNWTEKFPTSSPLPRAHHTMAYDSARSEVLLFGGNDNFGVFDETWVWSRGIDDDFNDNVLDTGLWSASIDPPGVGTITESSQWLEMVKAVPGVSFMGLASTCSVSGDFDVQVDYTLLTWPEQNSHTVRFAAQDLEPASFGKIGIYRNSNVDENYQFRAGQVVHQATNHIASTLRLTRVGSTISGHYHDGASFVFLGSATASDGPTRLLLDFSTPDTLAPGDIRIAFDTFQVNAADSISCPPGSP